MLYINDFAGVSEKLFYVPFADDTNIFLNGKDINKLVEIMNKLTLNLPKTHFIYIYLYSYTKYTF